MATGAAVKEVKTPNWKEDAKQFRDLALTSVSLGTLQELLDSQANAASCLQLSYLSTSSIPEVQNDIRDAAMQLWSADADATTTMALSSATATSVMIKLPDAFELLKNPETLPFAQDMLSEMAKDADTIQARFKRVAGKYTACSTLLSASLNKGNVARAALQKKVEEAQSVATSAQVSLEEFQKVVVDYNKQLTDMKQEQEDLDRKETEVIHQQFTVQMTETVMKGLTGMMSKAGEILLTVNNPEAAIAYNAAGRNSGGNGDEQGSASGTASGKRNSSSVSDRSSSVSADAAAANLEKHIARLAEAKTKVAELEGKLRKMSNATDEEKAKVQESLDRWNETVDTETIALEDASRANTEAKSNGDGAHHTSNGWDVARDISERAKIVQERRRDAEARRADAQANAIKFQAQLASLAKQAEYDEPHLDQIKTALVNLAKASTSVQALAVFWQSVQTIIDTLASKSEEIAKPNYLGALGKLSASAFVSVVNSKLAPGLVNLYGNWWAVMDICNAYTAAASKVIDTTAGKSMYEWTGVAPKSEAMKKLLDDAVAKGKAGVLLLDPPVMAPVGMISTAA